VARAWLDADEALSRADEQEPLGAEDLELLATAAFMLGRDDEGMRQLERAHHEWVQLGEPRRAVRCAFWIGIQLALRGDMGPATGWLGRAQRLLEGEDDCAEHGYLLIPVALEHELRGDWETAAAVAGDAARAGQRFGDSDLFALALHEQGHMLVRGGRVKEGLGLLDEAMVAVTAGELSPTVTGIVYCGVILACREVYELRRAQEWTAALTRWCEGQRDLVAFTGRCLIHRAEVMQLRGAWPDALEEARRAADRHGLSDAGTGHAHYLQGELHRLRGALEEAEDEYRAASRHGSEPQPGLALMRLAQGRSDAAAGAIRRALDETAAPLERTRLLPAFVEIMLAVGELGQARRSCDELGEIAERYEGGMLSAMAAHARGAVELAEGDPQAAVASLRQASQAWKQLEAPYDAARTRVMIAVACRSLGDEDTAALELEAARRVFEQLGAAPDLARVDALAAPPGARETHGLTSRELEVLRLVAAGESNRAIASALVISEHTVARHVQNIFAKLGVSSRTAASAFAYEHDLV
jgi:DNA-binding NarL/FixJ family response regulator